jgi:hypothetical protein
MHLATLLEADLASAGAVAAWATRETPLEEKKRARHTKQPGEFTMQRYVTRPATLGRRKFDLRLWTLVASLEPLSVYVLDVAFPRARRAAAAAAARGASPPPPAGRSPSSTTRAGACPATRVRSRPSACTSS